MKKVLIIGKRGFIGFHLTQFLKKNFYIKNISYRNLNQFKKKLNYFDFIINTSINKKYILNKYDLKFDNDLNISRLITNNRTIYCFISTRKVYPSKANLKENTKLKPMSHYAKNKIITEKKIRNSLRDNHLILRVSNILGNKKSIKSIHKTFIDIFLENVQKGIIMDNGKMFKDFISIDKFCEIIKNMIISNVVGTYNVSIGKKVYLNDLIGWLNKFNKKKLITIKNLNKKDSFFLNNKKLRSKIRMNNSIESLKKYSYELSRKLF